MAPTSTVADGNRAEEWKVFFAGVDEDTASEEYEDDAVLRLYVVDLRRLRVVQACPNRPLDSLDC